MAIKPYATASRRDGDHYGEIKGTPPPGNFDLEQFVRSVETIKLFFYTNCVAFTQSAKIDFWLYDVIFTRSVKISFEVVSDGSRQSG